MEQAPKEEPQNMARLLAEFMVKREDFERWLVCHGKDKPNFWFGDIALTSNQSPSPPIAPTFEQKLAKIVTNSFWTTLPPKGFNRPTKDEIIDWLMNRYENEGLTKKAAERVYQASKPNHIPKHGNLPQSNKPFPPPSYPD